MNVAIFNVSLSNCFDNFTITCDIGLWK
jgi:hypothetical protein